MFIKQSMHHHFPIWLIDVFFFRQMIPHLLHWLVLLMSTFSQRPYTDCRPFPFEYFFLLDANLKFNNFLISKLMTFYKHSFHTERIIKIQSRLLVFEIWLIFQWFWISDKSAENFKQVCYNTSVLSFWIPLFYSLSYF